VKKNLSLKTDVCLWCVKMVPCKKVNIVFLWKYKLHEFNPEFLIHS